MVGFVFTTRSLAAWLGQNLGPGGLPIAGEVGIKNHIMTIPDIILETNIKLTFLKVADITEQLTSWYYS